MKEVCDEISGMEEDNNVVQQKLLITAFALLISGVTLGTTALIALNFSNNLVSTALGMASAPMLIGAGFFGGASAFFGYRNSEIAKVNNELDALIDIDIPDQEYDFRI